MPSDPDHLETLSDRYFSICLRMEVFADIISVIFESLGISEINNLL